jgi:hypothetical protein
VPGPFGKDWSLSQGGVRGDSGALRRQDVPQPGRVVKCTAKGAVIELDVERGVVYGPMPWHLGGSTSFAAAITGGNYPHPGDRAVVLFAGVGTSMPVCVAWWRT